MKTRSQRLFQAKAQILKALSHPTRLLVVEELSRGERCVCELVDRAGADFSTVSKHLSVLKNAGLVDYEKRGLKVFYRLRVPCVLRFMDCIEAVLRSSLESQMETMR